jgi:peptide/nickel transport system substrate-binding protein
LLRQAISYATDYKAINGAVFEGIGTQARSIVPPIIPGADVKTWQFNTNLDKARQLLKQAGYTDGVDVTLEYAAIFWFEEQLAIQMKDQLAKAGIRVNLQKITDANMRSRTAPNKRDLPFFTFMDNPIVLDPVYALYLNAHSEGASNRNNYANPEFDKLVDAARIEQNPKKRAELVNKAQQMHIKDASWVMTMYPGAHEAMPTCMKGYVWQPDYHERWRELSCK